MSTVSFGRTLRTVGALLALGAGALGAQTSQGSINVHVTEAAGGRPLDQAQVVIVGTTLGGLTNADGRFTFRSVAPGAVTVRVLRVGYSEQKKAVTVVAGQAASLEFALSEVALTLAPVVTTATGDTRRVELGNAVASIDAAKIAESGAVQNVNDMLNSRTAGVTVTSGTQTGAGARIRIRGQNSLSLSNDPIFIIDGVRMSNNSNSSNLFTGGSQPSRIGDINPEEIESMEIVKGPSAATLYGTDAANGVVLISTKRGRAGAARWTVYAEGGVIKDQNTYPTNYTIFGRNKSTGAALAINGCNLPRVSSGFCTIDSVAKYNLFTDPDVTPLGTGNRNQYGLQLSGGTEAVRYFVSGEREDETGLLEIPDFERRRLDTLNLPLHDWTERPNALGKTSVRANINAAVSPKLDISASTGFVNLNQRFSLESNATAGLGSQAFGGPGCKICSPDRLVGTGGLATPLYGYRAWTPGYTWQEKTGQRVNRFIGSFNANWRPTSWLQNRLTLGNDYANRVDDNLLLRGEGPPITANYRLGFKQNSRTDIRNFTVDLGSTASYTPMPWLSLKTTGGVQYVNYLFELGSATGTQLAPGAQTAGAGAVPNAAEATTYQKTLGLFVEQAAAINDRLFLTAAVRTDQNSAFGTNFQQVYYPKGSLSWIMSDESFFPKFDWLNQFRFRASYGSSGVQPGPNDALRYYLATTANYRGLDQPAAVYTQIGNPDLKPERSTEFETGFDAKFLNNRYSLEVTYYTKKTKDAIISAIQPPSIGGPTTQRVNIGSVGNNGWEAIISAQVMDHKNFAWDVSLNGSTYSNELISLGGTPRQIGTTTRALEGYPLFGLWARAITGWQDKNGDKILTYNADPNLNEVFVADSFSFRGYGQPRNLVTWTNGFDFFSRRLRIQSMLDYRGGHKWYNNTERIRCVSRQNCNGLQSPGASFEEQAMVVATRDHPSASLDGFLQKGDFVRFRELTVQYSLSQDWSQRFFKSRAVSVLLTGRNLARWTAYRGVDPENDYQVTAGVDTPGGDFQGLGLPSYYILRVNINR
ncbi:MAG: SusC/RagA family TonB-linked outer membrane protein [Gemmatimonadaceae bacterium]|nr:SusC/RagA family TonB-linked outer membrane protein [Gemmatimonadaceae bacterium]